MHYSKIVWDANNLMRTATLPYIDRFWALTMKKREYLF